MDLLAVHGCFWSFPFHCLLSALLCGSNMCTQVSSPVSKLEITRLLQPLYVFKSSQTHFKCCRLLLSEQMRYPPSANLSQVQTLFQNCLHTAFWYASTTSYIFDRQSCILFDPNLYSRDVNLGNRGLGLSGWVSSSTENFPALKGLTHLKTAHWNGLRSIYTTYITGASNWYWLTVGQGLLSL